MNIQAVNDHLKYVQKATKLHEMVDFWHSTKNQLPHLVSQETVHAANYLTGTALYLNAHWTPYPDSVEAFSLLGSECNRLHRLPGAYQGDTQRQTLPRDMDHFQGFLMDGQTTKFSWEAVDNPMKIRLDKWCTIRQNYDCRAVYRIHTPEWAVTFVERPGFGDYRKNDRISLYPSQNKFVFETEYIMIASMALVEVQGSMEDLESDLILIKLSQ